MTSFAKKELAALSRMFSPGVLKEIGRTGSSPKLARLLADTTIPELLPSEATLADAYELAFNSLRKLGNRDDYVYRVALTQKIALGRHNLRTATVLNELRAGNSKADLVILNGTATAYEIKSERDSLHRLAGQLADYRSVFAKANVVTSPGQADAVLRIAPEDVGVIILSSRFRLQTVREAVNDPSRIKPLVLLNTLRTGEAIQVLENLGLEFSEVPNTQKWGMLQSMFADIDPASVHSQAVRVLKETRNSASLEPLVQNMPKPLTAAILSTDLSETARDNLRAATWQPMSSVLAWC